MEWWARGEEEEELEVVEVEEQLMVWGGGGGGGVSLLPRPGISGPGRSTAFLSGVILGVHSPARWSKGGVVVWWSVV